MHVLTSARLQLTTYADILCQCDIEWLPVGVMRVEAVIGDVLDRNVPRLLNNEQSILHHGGER
jgi:hypothetical protein